MVVYTIMHGTGESSAKTNLHLEGEVFSRDWDRLREFCLEALKNSSHLVLDLEKVSHYDFSLGIFVCLLRRTALLLGKRLTIRGGEAEFFCMFEATLGAKRCSFTRAGSCNLNENLFTRSRVA